MTYRLSVRDGFAAAHRLAGSGGRCENLHGHNFAVELTVAGEKLDPATGMLTDFGILKAALGRVLAGLDHRDLNALPALAGASPSSEVLAAHILGCAIAELAGSPVRVESVTVWESDRACATCRAPDDGKREG